MVENTHKYHNLEGLRGLAALVVVFWHFTIAFLPFLVGFAAVARHTPFDKYIANSPLFLPFAGSFAVVVFFVLSGFVLSLSFFKRRDSGVLVAAASRRYFRLMLPALGSVLLAYFIMKFTGAHSHLATAKITGSPWLTWFWNFPPHFGEAIRQGAYGAFFNQQNSYNTNLWTMYIELTGSFLVFGFLAFFGRLQKRWIMYLAFSLIFIHSWYLAFLFGIAICDVWVNYPSLKARLSAPYATLLLVAAVFLGSWHISFNIYTSVYSHLTLPFFTAASTEQLARTIGAALLIISVLSLPWLSRFFESRPLRYLGRISFSLYLVHLSIIYSFSCILFNRLLPHLGYGKSFLVMFPVSLALIMVISHYYTKYVDAPSIALSKFIGTWLHSPGGIFSKAKRTQAKATDEPVPAAPGLIVNE